MSFRGQTQSKPFSRSGKPCTVTVGQFFWIYLGSALQGAAIRVNHNYVDMGMSFGAEGADNPIN